MLRRVVGVPANIVRHVINRRELLRVTKADIVNIVAEGTGLTKVETAAVVDGVIATISYALKKGDTIDLRGLGRFKLVQRKERRARNLQSGESILVPAKKVPVFRSSKHLIRQVNEPFEPDNQFERKK